MIIPWQQIQQDTLTSILEDYASRDGTDYGLNEVSLASKVSQLRRQLETKQAVIVYSELHETVDIRLASDLGRWDGGA